jgi:hypothetical protein
MGSLLTCLASSTSKEETSLTHVDVAQKVKQGFDIERVTKQFFQNFEGLHQNFC